jgi:hypothetical protein
MGQGEYTRNRNRFTVPRRSTHSDEMLTHPECLNAREWTWVQRISVAERSFPLVNWLEMLCQPHAQFLLHRWG